MSNDRRDPDKRKPTGAGADAAANDQQHARTRERDGSGEQGHEGTASGSRRDRPKDDPSHAPESGTP